MRRLVLLGAIAGVLEATAARAEPASAPTVASPAAPSAPPDDALRVEVARQGAALDALLHPAVRVSGFVQIDWVVHNEASQNEVNGSTGLPLNQDRFNLRRGRVRVDADQGLVLGALEIDASTNAPTGAQVRPIDAEVSLRWPERPDPRVPSLLATAGLQRIPFGYEVQELDTVRPFLERSTMMQALFPGEFDLGLRFKAQYRFLDAAIAVMNGNPNGSKVFPDLDPVQTKDLVGRVGAEVEIAPGVRVQWGVSADTGLGFHPGAAATKFQLVWQDQNGDGLVEPNEIIAVGGTPATPSQTFRRFALGGDARIAVRLAPLGDLSFRGEVVNALNLDRGLEVADPVGAGHDLRELGWSGGATLEVTRWGMIGARYDVYNPDGDASQQRALRLVPVDRTYSTLALMGMVRYGRQRLLLEYDINRNPLGVSTSGAPTTLADNALTFRAQVVF